jgi:excisionase family DNA binding protein
VALDHEILTIKEVSELLRVTKNTVYKFVRQGRIPSFRIGRDLRFRADEIARWMDEKGTPVRRAPRQPLLVLSPAEQFTPGAQGFFRYSLPRSATSRHGKT